MAAASLLPSANDTGFIFPSEEREETSEEDADEDDSCGGGCVPSAGPTFTHTHFSRKRKAEDAPPALALLCQKQPPARVGCLPQRVREDC